MAGKKDDNKAAASAQKAKSKGSKAKKKKWSKGKVKEKVNNDVFFTEDTLNKCISEIPKSKLITTSVIVDRLHVNGSVARRALRILLERNLIKPIAEHHKQSIYTRASH